MCLHEWKATCVCTLMNGPRNSIPILVHVCFSFGMGLCSSCKLGAITGKRINKNATYFFGHIPNNPIQGQIYFWRENAITFLQFLGCEHGVGAWSRGYGSGNNVVTADAKFVILLNRWMGKNAVWNVFRNTRHTYYYICTEVLSPTTPPLTCTHLRHWPKLILSAVASSALRFTNNIYYNFGNPWVHT